MTATSARGRRSNLNLRRTVASSTASVQAEAERIKRSRETLHKGSGT